jgi:hypothetical protein
MQAKSDKELLNNLQGVLQVEGDNVTVLDEAALREKVDMIVHTAVFGEGVVRETARWLLWQAGQALGIYPSSIHELYMAIGRGDVPAHFTVPAMNIRAMNFNSARAVFRAANKLNAGAFIFEIARSEMGYTDQRPAEYVASLWRRPSKKASAARSTSRATIFKYPPKITRPTPIKRSTPCAT